MSAGQGSYYADLAREDYYLTGGEPPGLWMGEGAKKLGFTGDISRNDFLELFEGRKGSEKLVQNAGFENHRPGWDITFSAPKTVSVAWALADQETSLQIRDAHLEAVKRSIEYLEKEAIFTRRGKGGRELERCDAVFATFEHGTSRAQEAQLHTHALLLNIGVRQDGKTSTLETRSIYLSKMVAGALYRSELAYQLERRLGLFSVPRSKDSTFDLRGVPKELADIFSTRRHEIEKALKEKGLRSSRAAEFAALDTRGVKGHISREKLFEKARTIGKEHGWGPKELQTLMHGPQKERCHSYDLSRACVEATEKITQQSAYFTERELLRRVAVASQTMAAGALEVRASVTEHLKDPERIVRVGTRHKEPMYTTREMLALEHDLLTMVKDASKKRWDRVSDKVIEKVIAARPTMKEEQRKALKHVTQDTGMIASVTGMAGTGKTFMLAATREALEAADYRVIGAALAGKAAEGLQEGSGIKSSTIARLLLRIEGGYEKLDSKTVLVLDEAGMIGTRQMHRIQSEAQKGGAKLVLVGDEKQLQPIEAGGPFGAISKEIGTTKLTDIVRQHEKWQRQAVKDFAEGEAKKALEEFAKRGFVDVARDRDAAKDTLLESWKKNGMEAPEKNLIVAATNQDATDLNRRIQDLRQEKTGSTPKAPIVIEGEKFYGGDRILFTRNSKAVGVQNGSLGTIKSVKGNQLTVELDNEKRVTFSVKNYAHVKLGYAVTTHKAQGVTVDNVYILTNEMMQDRELTYVQASRARNDARFFTTEAEAGEGLKNLTKSMERSSEKILASKFRESELNDHAKEGIGGKPRREGDKEGERHQAELGEFKIDPDIVGLQQLRARWTGQTAGKSQTHDQHQEHSR